MAFLIDILWEHLLDDLLQHLFHIVPERLPLRTFFRCS